MPAICPTITAYSEDEYRLQMEKVDDFAERIHIDLTDGKFTLEKTVSPDKAWWPVGLKADFHLMYRQPDEAADVILRHHPNLIIVHAEADGDFGSFAAHCHKHGVKAGVAIMPQTAPAVIERSLDNIDHIMIFSGNLGHQGGSHANLDLLRKVELIRQVAPNIEIGWDGGINPQNISRLAFGGVEVFNVGSYIQSANNAQSAYETLFRIAQETGTT